MLAGAWTNILRAEEKLDYNFVDDQSIKTLLYKYDSISSKDNDGERFQDVHYAILASAFASKGNIEKALQYCWLSFRQGTPKVKQWAIEKWWSTYVKQTQYDFPKTPQLLKQRLPLYFEKVSSANELEEAVAKDLADYVMLKKTFAENILKDDLSILSPQIHNKKIEEAANLLCDSSSYVNTELKKKFLAKLSPLVASYHKGVYMECMNNAGGAVFAYQKAIERVIEKKKYPQIYLNSLRRLIGLQRRLGKRDEAATNYGKLTVLWQNYSASDLDLTSKKAYYYANKIDDILMAARYQALVGNYSKAIASLRLVDSALEEAAFLQVSNFDFENLRAEAVFVEAHRVLVEKGQYRKAAALLDKARTMYKISEEWKKRLLWYQGLYEYIGGDLVKALQHWSSLLESAKEQEAALHFWISRVYEGLGRKDDALRHLAVLTQKYPLSFYSVIGAKSNVLATKAQEKEVVADKLLSDPRIKPFYLRAKILLAHNMDIWSELAAQELYTNLEQIYSVSAATDDYLIASRFLLQAGSYDKGIGATERILSQISDLFQRSPEQLAVFFPKPVFIPNIEGKSAILGVARQESKFNSKAVSSAGAYGVMQLIEPTAARMAEDLGYDWKVVKGELFKPEMNVILGAQYLEQLKKRYKNLSPFVFAAYNAGEFVADAWKKRRFHPDSLVWIELIPFLETKVYVQKVMRNTRIYESLELSGK